MTSIDCKTMSIVLKKSMLISPKTCQFESKYGQKDNRWWDDLPDLGENRSKQQYHVVNYFGCKYINGWSYPSKCKLETNECLNCYKKLEENLLVVDGKQIDAEVAYKKMNRPEMFLWIIEAMDILDEEQLTVCFKDIERIWKSDKAYQLKMSEMKSTVGEYISWEDIENKEKNWI